MDIYDRIKKVRAEKHMSQEELAKKVGYTHRSSIGKIENGEVNLPQSRIKAFADALDVDEAWLMGYEVPKEKSNPLYGEAEGFELADGMVIDPEVDSLLRVLQITLYNIPDNEERAKALNLLRATLDLIKK